MTEPSTFSTALANETATAQLMADLALLIGPGDVITLSGDLGAGKSAAARAIIRYLAFRDSGGDEGGDECWTVRGSDAPGASRQLRLRDALRGGGHACLQVDGGVGHLVELGKHVARHQDRASLVGEASHELAQRDPSARIEAGGGLVEKQHTRVVHEGAGEAEALFLTT